MNLLEYFFPFNKFTGQKLPRELQSILSFSYGKIDLYRQALTHKSALAKGNVSASETSNERLEFLGDAIVNAVVSDYLFQKFPGEDEGFLTKARSKIVSRGNLSKTALKMNLHKLLVSSLGKVDISETLFGNALEALIGAIYMDKGYRAASKFVHAQLLNKHIDINELLSMEVDYKSSLLEWCQKNKKRMVFIVEQDESKAFVSELFIDDEKMATGHGTSKKRAEQKASEKAWHLVGGKE